MRQEVIDMTIEIEGSLGAIQIPDGMHKGVIIDVQKNVRGAKEFEYFDVYVEVAGITNDSGEPVRIKDSMPFNLTPNTKLGKTVMRFGVDKETIISGHTIDLEKVFLSKMVSFQTIQEVSERGTFSRVVEGSLKPIEEGASPSSTYNLTDEKW